MTNEQNCRLMPSAAASVASRIVASSRKCSIRAVRTSTAREPELRPVSRFLLSPPLVDRSRFRLAVRPIEQHYFAFISVRLEKALQIILRAVRLGEDHGLVCSSGT